MLVTAPFLFYITADKTVLCVSRGGSCIFKENGMLDITKNLLQKKSDCRGIYN